MRSGPALAQRCRSVRRRVEATLCGSASCSALSGSIRPEPKLSSRSPGAEPPGARSQNAADVGRREFRIALEQQRHDAAHLGGRDRGAGGELVGVLRRRHQDVDAGRGHRDIFAAIGAGEQLVVDVGRRHRDHVGIGAGKSGGDFGPALPAAAISTMPLS